LRLAGMKISIYALYAKERFEIARQHSILHPERIVVHTENALDWRSATDQSRLVAKDLAIVPSCEPAHWTYNVSSLSEVPLQMNCDGGGGVSSGHFR
jgi:hypothetical protein